MISAESVAFFPRVYANCCTGWMAWRSSSSFQPASCGVVQSPYARLMVGVPYFAISSSNSVVRFAVVLSESIRTASRVASGVVTKCGGAEMSRIVAEPRSGRMPVMDLRQLEYFVAVARHRHFTRAAEALYVTQPALSQQIRRLEAELGLQLLSRTPQGVEVTPAGQDLLLRAEAILGDVAAAREAMDEHAGVLRGSVRVAAA